MWHTATPFVLLGQGGSVFRVVPALVARPFRDSSPSVYYLIISTFLEIIGCYFYLHYILKILMI